MNLVWRISKSAPAGELVDMDALPPTSSSDEPEDSDAGWAASSLELLSGTEIHEGRDCVEGDLFDEHFAPDSAAPTIASRN